jgi:hypothetical protein
MIVHSRLRASDAVRRATPYLAVMAFSQLLISSLPIDPSSRLPHCGRMNRRIR